MSDADQSPERLHPPTPAEIVATMSDAELTQRVVEEIWSLGEGQAVQFMPDGTTSLHEAIRSGAVRDIPDFPDLERPTYDWFSGPSNADWLTKPMPADVVHGGSGPRRVPGPTPRGAYGELRQWWQTVPSAEDIRGTASRIIPPEKADKRLAPSLTFYDSHGGLRTLDLPIPQLIASGEIEVKVTEKEGRDPERGPHASVTIQLGVEEYVVRTLFGDRPVEDIEEVAFVSQRLTDEGDVAIVFHELRDLQLPSLRAGGGGGTAYASYWEGEHGRAPGKDRAATQAMAKAIKDTREAFERLGDMPELVRVRSVAENFRALLGLLERQGSTLLAKLDVPEIEHVVPQLFALGPETQDGITFGQLTSYWRGNPRILFEAARRHVEANPPAGGTGQF